MYFKVNSILIGVTSRLIDIGNNISKGNDTETVQGITISSLCQEFQLGTNGSIRAQLSK